MFAKVKWSQNMFLWIRKVFCSHLAYPKPFFVVRSVLKLIGNRIYQDFQRNRLKNPVITIEKCPERGPHTMVLDTNNHISPERGPHTMVLEVP